MRKNPVILLADNDPDFLNTRRQFLESAGYSITLAHDESEARRQLRENTEIDLAILDIRLIDDNDNKDLSGLDIAREEAHRTPKIILTSFSTVDGARLALKSLADGVPPAVEFVDKHDGPQALFAAIRYALGPDTAWMRDVKTSLDQNDQMLADDYRSTQRQSIIYFVTSMITALIGIMILFCWIILAFVQGQNGFTIGQQITIGLLSTTASVVIEAVSALFFRRADAANRRMDHYHAERQQGRRFEILLDACNTIASPVERETCRIQIIQAASADWLMLPAPGKKG